MALVKAQMPGYQSDFLFLNSCNYNLSQDPLAHQSPQKSMKF